jgi:beta-N-acetylhexosaminidase
MKYCLLVVTPVLSFLCYAGSAERTLAELTLREKIGQLMVIAAASDFGPDNEALAKLFLKDLDTMKPEMVERLIKEYSVGGVIFLMKGTPEKHSAFIQRYQAASKLPLLMCLDAEWGLSMRLEGTVRFPKNITLGALQDEQLVYRLGKEIGRQCNALGLQVNFAPVIDVNNNPENPVINDRSFGEDKEKVARLGALYADGLQSSGVIGCAKHFPGHGDVAVDSHYALPCITHTAQHIDQTELYPFKYLIAQGVPAVMTAHLLIPSLDETQPSSLSYAMVTELLQNKLGFTGLVVSDDLGMAALKSFGTPAEIVLKAFCAGTDILLCPAEVPDAIELIEEAVLEGRVSMEELDAKVLKILKAKETAGLFENRMKDAHLLKDLASDAALALKKELFSQAITLVQNKQVLPLDSHVPVIQIGGTQEQPFVKGFIKVYYHPAHALDDDNAQLIRKLGDSKKVVIGVFEMNKFARKNFGLSEGTLSFIKQLNEGEKEVILVLFGSPYSLHNFGDEAAVIIAYEDDPDAQTAASEIVFGTLKARGRLPVTASAKFCRGAGL